MTKNVLKNGLTVYTIENHTQPLVTMDMWVGVGSKDEPAELAGVSHFLEHMLFKGTERLAVGEYDRRMEALGGYLNAATSSDYTHYYVILPSENLDGALADMADVLVNSALDPAEVDSERRVILEEIRQKQDNPTGFLYDEITRRAFESGPYAGTVIGTEETVSSMTRDQLFEHYQRHYTPDNMAFIVAGDFHTPKLLDRLEELFAEFTREKRPWREAPPPTRFSDPQVQTWDRDWQQTYFFVTTPGPAVTSIAEMAAWDVAETLLLGGRSSRLVNQLREKKRLVTSISGFFPSHKHASFLAIYGACDAERVEEARAAIFAEIDTLREKGPGAEELAKAKRQIVTSHLYHAETNTGQAGMVGYSHSLFGTPILVTDFPAAVEKVTAEDVQRVLAAVRAPNSSLYVARPAKAAVGR